MKIELTVPQCFQDAAKEVGATEEQLKEYLESSLEVFFDEDRVEDFKYELQDFVENY